MPSVRQRKSDGVVELVKPCEGINDQRSQKVIETNELLSPGEQLPDLLSG